MFTAVKRYFRKDLIPLLADLKLAIALLLAIAIFSISGTVIEQGQGLTFYQENYPESPALFGFLTWKFILILGLDHVYRTWWFLSILILFGASLTACTFTRQITALRWFSRTWNFYSKPRQFEKMALSTELETGDWDVLRSQLSEHRYKVYEKSDSDDTMLYAQKGLSGRIGPIVVHASMLLILGGAILGSMTGFFAQEMVPSGQTFKVQNIFDAGPWAGPQIPKDWSVHVNRFWIDYSPEGRVDQFYSDLSVLDSAGEEVKRKTIWVNQPLRYKNVTLYQADWAIGGVKVRINNSPTFELAMAPLDVEGAKLWGTWVPTKPDMSAGVSLIAQDLQGTLLLYDMSGKLVSTVRQGSSVEVNGVRLYLDEIIGSTGLQIKADPGIPVVYLGFGLLMVGVVMSYISHSQVWALKTADKLFVGGRTNRAQVSFEKELISLLDETTKASVAQTTAPIPANTTA
ncbi:cytochrome c biogenesis protein [cf. Phormidesmis sp. LEGE 11477]|uniref:cytochrome c biogenesis protein n=1 Tax=cf. Phormidesmis sp. LEGE 11477 TaxID=1828680 RepID=UPI00187DEC4C|nr:cytochrome c biogenesis protein [cf. Phormidesmis sp. LEGE 11477]MBE9060533.1 cytochrome c biogenesis protein [cf. Phormidesmis sp. LEGE 11477]